LPQSPLVCIVDSDPDTTASIQHWLVDASLETRVFPGAPSFLEAFDPECVGCIVANADKDGPRILDGLRLREASAPLILLSGKADVSSAVRALRAGAYDYLETPVAGEQLVDSVRSALEKNASEREREREWSETRTQLDRLTPREREVLELVVSGKSNRLIASELALSHKTIEIHRSRMMRKMQAPSLAQLVGKIRCLRCADGPGAVD